MLNLIHEAKRTKRWNLETDEVVNNFYNESVTKINCINFCK